MLPITGPIQNLRDKLRRAAEVRELAGDSVFRVAELMGVDYRTLRQWERGNQWPRTRDVFLLWNDYLDQACCKIAGVTTEEEQLNGLLSGEKLVG